MPSLQLWAGPECTVNRVGNHYCDQLELTGFARRTEDLHRLAELGIKRIRFPLLWERTAPSVPDQYQWQWSDLRLQRLRELQVAPIVGLIHHGSGPPYTDLLDEQFPQRFAAYARAVAERYPEVDAYTPVNEPVTTARFSGLYGFWYPHRHDDRSFVRALMNQMLGTVRAMREIRKINSDAQLIQTDDLGYTTTPAHLGYQADFENLRRWLSFDLLTGRITPQHRLWDYLIENGATERELASFDDRCAPDIVGINCYVTSERFLDDRLALYPRERHHDNGRDKYVDVESVRVLGAFIGGFEKRVREASHRYELPVAITEVHMGCTRDEQLRWFHQAWQSAAKLHSEGVDIRAVTAWATFGAVDWNSLVTRDSGHYEAGLWDVSSGCVPRKTALGTLARQLAAGSEPDHPALAGVGWWQRQARLTYPPHGEVRALPPCGPPLLITGATGTLGQAFARLCETRGLPAHLLTRAQMDIASESSVAEALQKWKPWAVINTAGFVRVDDAEHEPRQWRENVIGPTVLARACAEEGVRLLSFSSDLVFDGSKPSPYVESDSPHPLSAYGRSKLEAERRVLKLAPNTLVIRSAAFFGPWDRYNFVARVIHSLRQGERWPAANDQWVSPTYVPNLVQAALDLLIDGEQGVWHLTNRGVVSWSGFAQMVAEASGLDAGLVDPVPGASLGQVAPRPRYSALRSERGMALLTLDDALGRYLADLEPEPALVE